MSKLGTMNATSAKRPEALIVGAGPTGLAAAMALAKFGISVRVIDKNSARSDKSKALGVQAGTLEYLDRAIDPALSKRMIEAGQPAKDAWIHLNDAAPIRMDFSTVPSQYDFILILAQSETEEIFEEYLNSLGIQVERQTELVELRDRGSDVVSTLRHADGRTEEIVSSFVIGADGAHSTVRGLCDIPFRGAAYTGDFILGDVTLEWPWAYQSIRTFVSSRGVIASFPMKGERKYRLILIPKETRSNSDTLAIGIDEFRSIASKLSQDQIKILDSSWLTRFRVHHRMVQNFQKGRIFLAGDAAHIHSPAGGQGMNTGIQDSLNLAFKLKRVISDRAPLKTLHRYERERLPVARRVLRGTDFVFRLAIMPETPLTSLVRRAVLRRLVSCGFIQRRIVSSISEIAVAKREIARFTESRRDR